MNWVARNPRPIGTTPQLIVGAAVLVIILLAGYAFLDLRTSQPSTITSAGPTVDQLQELSELIVLRVQISDVLVADDPAGARMALLIRGDADLVIDLARARLAEKDENNHTATVVLPHPRVVRPRVDHERTRVYKVEKTTWIPWRDPRDRLYEEGMKQAQKLIEFAVSKDEEKARARCHAELLIREFYRQFGWTVDVRWK